MEYIHRIAHVLCDGTHQVSHGQNEPGDVGRARDSSRNMHQQEVPMQDPEAQTPEGKRKFGTVSSSLSHRAEQSPFTR